MLLNRIKNCAMKVVLTFLMACFVVGVSAARDSCDRTKAQVIETKGSDGDFNYIASDSDDDEGETSVETALWPQLEVCQRRLQSAVATKNLDAVREAKDCLVDDLPIIPEMYYVRIKTKPFVGISVAYAKDWSGTEFELTAENLRRLVSESALIDVGRHTIPRVITLTNKNVLHVHCKLSVKCK